jgi:L,D-transpeptidase-like protein
MRTGLESRFFNAFSAVALVVAFSATAMTLVLPAEAAKRSRKSNKPAVEAQGPLTLMVSLKRQRVDVYDKNGKITSAPISSGRAGNRTPTGVFSILQKRRRHYSNLYGSAMPNMQRITWSGIALHAGPLPGYPASHGCIRLPYRFSKRLFSMTGLGTRVIVTHHDDSPRSFAHPKLLKPLPPGDPKEYASLADTALEHQSTGADAASMLLGVTPAHASEHIGLPEGIERTRAAVEAYRLREITMLEEKIASIQDWHKKASGKLKTANAVLRDAIKAERELQPEARNITQRLKASEAALSATRRSFRDFMLRAAAVHDQEALSKAALEEEALEATALRHLNEIELALSDRDALDDLLEERRAAVEKAKTRRDILQDRFAAARKSLSQTRTRLKESKEAYKRRERPITILLSKKTSKLYVRQGYDPVMQADVKFDDPDSPIGTHLFHAIEYNRDGTDLRWQAVTAARKYKKTVFYRTRRGRKRRKKVQLPLGPAQTPENALKRVTIPDKVADMLAELIKPGSAIIITDERKSNETGKYTDLIVTTR